MAGAERERPRGLLGGGHACEGCGGVEVETETCASMTLAVATSSAASLPSASQPVMTCVVGETALRHGAGGR